jgi:hypothetical protein
VGIVIEVRNPGNAVGLFPFIGQPHEPFPGLLRAASETDEMKAGLHEVIRFAAPENDPSWLPSPHEENDWSFVGFPWLPAVDGTRLACISAPL